MCIYNYKYDRQSLSFVEFLQKRFIVPTNSYLDRIPFARVNHNKYMVTDVAAYIGTSNWSGDYFIDTAGKFYCNVAFTKITQIRVIIKLYMHICCFFINLHKSNCFYKKFILTQIFEFRYWYRI